MELNLKLLCEKEEEEKRWKGCFLKKITEEGREIISLLFGVSIKLYMFFKFLHTHIYNLCEFLND